MTSIPESTGHKTYKKSEKWDDMAEIFAAERRALVEKSASATNANAGPQAPQQGKKRSRNDQAFISSPDCDKVRRRLRAFINSGEMKMFELHKALGVSGKSFNGFMSQSGKDKGACSDTYSAAYQFFVDREARGIKAPAPKRAKKSEEKTVDLSGVQLNGEDKVAVPVLDSCDEVRKKINAHLRDPGHTQAAFMREIVKTYPDGRKIQSKQLHTFLGQKGALDGNTSAVYYAAYVYFEKLRIKDNKPKSNHREEMEKRHPRGVDTSRSHKWTFCSAGQRPTYDQYGELHFVPSGRR